MSTASVVFLPHAPASVPVARERLSAELLASGVFESNIEDANVVVSELLSNSLRHARPLPSGQIRVAWTWDADALEVAVSDGGASTEPRRGRHTLSSLGGRGLGIVEALSLSWGVRHEDGCTTVWAVLRAPAMHPPKLDHAHPQTASLHLVPGDLRRAARSGQNGSVH